MASLRLIPLGGLGQIGMNCLLVESAETRFVIDCGVGFCPDGAVAERMHADLRALEGAKLDAIVITHGHEDHIGALPFLLQTRPAPVYAPPHAAALIAGRLSEHPGLQADLREQAIGETIGIGDCGVERFAVHHSIVGATGLVIHSPIGTIVHSGDFKIERAPCAGQRFDREWLQGVARSGVRLLLSDSTNALREGWAGDEASVASALARHVGEANRCVVVTAFSSNTFRLQALVEIAASTGRRLCLLGRSLRTHAETAARLGELRGLDAITVGLEQAAELRPDKLLVACSGSQGDVRSALHRLAHGEHEKLTVREGDTLIFSAKPIPGNERRVADLQDAALRRGVRVITPNDDPALHVSGHACQAEQRELIELLQPRAFLPVHGTLAHLQAHEHLARKLGVPQTAVIENGSILEVTKERMGLAGHVPHGKVYLDGNDPLSAQQLRVRETAARAGIASVTLRASLEFVRVELAGIADSALQERAETFLRQEMNQYAGEDEAGLKSQAIQALLRFFRHNRQEAPWIVVTTVK